MSSLNTLTGRLGRHVVDDQLVARTTAWEVNKTLASKSEWGDSDSNGFTNRAPGRKDATYTTEGKFDTTDEVYDLLQPEDIVESVLWMNTTSLYWAFPRALVDDFSLSVNIDSEEVIGWTASCGADGVFYYPGEASAPSHTLPS